MSSGETEIGTERGITVIATSCCENETVSEATSVTTTPQCKLRKEYNTMQVKKTLCYYVFKCKQSTRWPIDILKQKFQKVTFVIYRKQLKTKPKFTKNSTGNVDKSVLFINVFCIGKQDTLFDVHIHLTLRCSNLKQLQFEKKNPLIKFLFAVVFQFSLLSLYFLQ